MKVITEKKSKYKFRNEILIKVGAGELRGISNKYASPAGYSLFIYDGKIRIAIISLSERYPDVRTIDTEGNPYTLPGMPFTLPFIKELRIYTDADLKGIKFYFR